MNITDVQIYIVNEEKLKAYATITLDACFVVRDLKVIKGQAGIFVAMPAKKRKDGTFRDVAHPVNQEARARLESQVIEAYHQALHETEPTNSGTTYGGEDYDQAETA